jgi:predicted Zn-dependent peptidase
MEKNVILEEIAMYNDRPDSLIIDDLLLEAFGNHPLGHSVLGTEKTVGPITRDQMAEYHKRRYSASNLTFIITGSFDRNEIIHAVETHCGSWLSGDQGREQPTPTFQASSRVVKREGVAREHIALALPAPPAPDDQAVTADLLSAYLGASTNSKLYWSVIQEGLADEASAEYIGFSDAGLFHVYASVDPQNAARVLDIIRHEMADLKNGIDADALERAKTKLATGLICSGENGLSRFSQIVGNLGTTTPLKTLKEERAEIDAVTPESITNYLEAYPLDLDPALVALGPLESLT